MKTRAARTGRPGATLRCLRADEAAFIDAAFQCILPEARAEGLEISASAYVDRRLAAPSLPAGKAEPNLDLRMYRSAIADVQAFCERTLGRRFQALAVWQQLAVLAQLERPAGAARGLRRYLMDLLLNDAAEAYFDVASSSWADAHEALRAVAA